MQFYVSRLLLVVTRAALKVSGLLFWILVYVAALLAAASYLPEALRLVAKGPFRAFHWKPRKAAPACLTSSKHGQHGQIRIKKSGIRFHYVASGEKGNPLMLLLHGFPENWYSWRYQLDEFCQEYWTVAVDLRGFGSSDSPPDLRDYRMETLLQDIQDLITGLDYVLAHASQLFSSRYVFLFQLPILPEILLSLGDFENIRKPLIDANMGIQNKKRRLSKDEIEAFVYYPSQKGALTPALNYYRNLFGFFPVKAQDVLVPTLLLWGEQDTFLEAAMVPEMQQYVHAPFQAEIIPNASHWLQQDEPEEVNRMMWDFLRQEMPVSTH
ncbi:epoxide hydrolase 3 isoform X2 [Engystomops pustulosus]|uniref:epoxide hydrolase 3 isoform X2 n=1 Tax=Engystomops pustulosus TaxID=76066 RepID=UPI003AFB13CF